MPVGPLAWESFVPRRFWLSRMRVSMAPLDLLRDVVSRSFARKR